MDVMRQNQQKDNAHPVPMISMNRLSGLPRRNLRNAGHDISHLEFCEWITLVQKLTDTQPVGQMYMGRADTKSAFICGLWLWIVVIKSSPQDKNRCYCGHRGQHAYFAKEGCRSY